MDTIGLEIKDALVQPEKSGWDDVDRSRFAVFSYSKREGVFFILQ